MVYYAIFTARLLQAFSAEEYYFALFYRKKTEKTHDLPGAKKIGGQGV